MRFKLGIKGRCFICQILVLQHELITGGNARTIEKELDFPRIAFDDIAGGSLRHPCVAAGQRWHVIQAKNYGRALNQVDCPRDFDCSGTGPDPSTGLPDWSSRSSSGWCSECEKQSNFGKCFWGLEELAITPSSPFLGCMRKRNAGDRVVELANI